MSERRISGSPVNHPVIGNFHVYPFCSRLRVLRLPAWGGCLGGLSFRSLVGELQIPVSVTVESSTCFVNLWCHCILTLTLPHYENQAG